jgi:alpha-D-ribose 1-methylphosphonate 5-triphosphate synthase subunit PhnG
MVAAVEPGETAGTGQRDPAMRKRRIEMLARAPGSELQALVDGFADVPAATALRGPETGLIMVRGRMGGTGSLFNLGEATVTRTTVRLSTGEIGHGQRLGGDKAAARLSAIVDALGETAAFAAPVADFVDGIAAGLAADEARLAEETAATRVDFFTMVRGDD